MRDKVVSLEKRPYKKRKPKRDSKLKSISEALINVCISLPIAFTANMIILPIYSESIYFADSLNQQSIIYLQLAIIFTAISLVRMYSLRRIFNKIGPGETGYSIIIRLIKNKK